MAIRPGRSVRDINKVAWTRYSRSKPKKSYIKAMPHKDLNVFRMGTRKPDYNVEFNLVSNQDIIIRDNAIESARQSSNKHLEKIIPGNYYFIVKIIPHHIIRENKMIAGAGADRLQKGMRQSFGRPTDRAARVYKGSSLFTIYTTSEHKEHIKVALEKAKRKISGSFTIKVGEIIAG